MLKKLTSIYQKRVGVEGLNGIVEFNACKELVRRHPCRALGAILDSYLFEGNLTKVGCKKRSKELMKSLKRCKSISKNM